MFKIELNGNKKESIRNEELKVGFITYGTLAEYVGDMILCNNMQDRLYNTMELYSGTEYNYFNNDYQEITKEEYEEKEENNEEVHEELKDVYQYYIIGDSAVSWLSNNSDEIIYYDNELDLYVWGIQHCGTSWDYVFTDIPVRKESK